MTREKKIAVVFLIVCATYSIGVMSGMLIEKQIKYTFSEANSIKANGIELPNAPKWYPKDMSCFDDVDNQLTVCVMRNDR